MPERQTSPAEVSPDEVDRVAVDPHEVQATDGVSPDAPPEAPADVRPETPRPAEPAQVGPHASPDAAPPAPGPALSDDGAAPLFVSSTPTPPSDPEPAHETVQETAHETAHETTQEMTRETAQERTAPAPSIADAATVVLPPVTGSTEEIRGGAVGDTDAGDAEAGDAGDAGDAEAGEAPDPDDQPTELIPAASGPPSRRRRRVLVVTGAVAALLAALYVFDVVVSSGTVPRGVTVSGVKIGGLRPDAAEQRVRDAVEPRTTRPVDVAVGGVTSQIDPKAAGLSVDWPATIAQAGAQPLNPITRVRSFFTRREVGVVTDADADAVDGALQQLVPVVNRPAAEGSVRFDGVTPVPVAPVDGQELDLDAARQVLERDWTSGAPVQLPVRVLKPTTSQDDVTTAVTDVATPAVSGPVTVQGENVTATVTPEVIAKALTFRADPGQGLVPELNEATVQEALDPQLAKSEQPGRDASLTFVAGKPVVTPSQDGRGVDYDATLKDLLAVLTRTGDDRRIIAVYGPQPAELTTEQLNGLGIAGVIGEFSTGGFAPDSGQNIKRAAGVINGKIVKPGQTFSLNAATEPRDAAHGYVEAGVISDGHAARDIGGGVSQVATTLYNAAYFAGMTDVVHKPHSFYISRYPPGREATVVSGPLDLKFRNDNPTGVLIQTVWTPSTLTVRLYGTKRYDVTSNTGPRTKPTDPQKVELPAGPDCKPSLGAPGFTITDTRTLRDVKTGQVKTERRTTKYNPSPIVTCDSG